MVGRLVPKNVVQMGLRARPWKLNVVKQSCLSDELLVPFVSSVPHFLLPSCCCRCVCVKGIENDTKCFHHSARRRRLYVTGTLLWFAVGIRGRWCVVPDGCSRSQSSCGDVDCTSERLPKSDEDFLRKSYRRNLLHGSVAIAVFKPSCCYVGSCVFYCVCVVCCVCVVFS